MKKYLILLLIPFLLGAAPSRLYTYTSGTTIESSKVTANEDAIFNYLSAGVDTYKALSIENADVSNTAAISDAKLDLATIAQAVKFNGAVTFTTIADLGTVTTGTFTGIDINAGAIDGTLIGQSSADKITGTIVKANTSLQISTGSIVRLILDEDSLNSNNDEALATQQSIKTYIDAAGGSTFITADGTFTPPAGVTKVYLTMVGGGGGGGGSDTSSEGGGGGAGGAWIIDYPYTVTPSVAVTVQVGDGGAGGGAGDNDGTIGQDTIFDTGGGTITVGGGNYGQKGSVGTGGVATGGDYDASAATAGGYTGASGAGGDGGASGAGGGGTPFGIGAVGTLNGNGVAGTANTGAGGGGGEENAGNKSGGAGGSGFVLVTW